MKNPFSADTLGEEKLKRNAVPLSYDNFFTANFGQLMPAFVQEVIPGDTIRIKSGTMLGIRGMPTIFPVQTKIRAGIEFYYVRNRTLMDNWEDFIFKTKDIEQAWLKLDSARAKKMISTGSLGDMFGVATTHALSEPVVYSYDISTWFSYKSATAALSTFAQFEAFIASLYANEAQLELGVSSAVQQNANTIGYFCKIDVPLTKVFFSKPFRTTTLSASHYDCYVIPMPYSDPNNAQNIPLSSVIFDMGIDAEFSDDGYCTLKYTFSDLFWNWYSSQDLSEGISLYIFKWEKTADTYFNYTPTSASLIPSKLVFPFITEDVIDATDDRIISDNPYVGSSPKKRLNVLPFRAYEMICNYYYRNDKNNPYYLNGEPQYNQFIPSTADGADENLYEYHYRNWELDMFTSAVQSPQFGEAPLVGLTYNPLAESAEFTFDVTDADGVSVEAKATLGVDSDGNFDSIADFSKELPSANLRRLQQMVNYGISINDLRVTNAFQRFKENTLRKGLRYRNQLKSHMGVSVDYPDIDIPQYIGGFNGDIVAGQVTNTADSPNAGLGDYVGTLNGGIRATRDITCFCPEHGFIIGIFSFAPSPAYPQSTKKIMLKTDAFDYFQKEFSKIGFVPIHYSEVAPLQTPDDGDIEDVFGYQKVNYDYLMNLDEIHGDFRTTLRNFCLGRTFAERPLLSESFVKVKPEQLNEIFVTDNIADAYGSNAKFMVAARFIASGARPVSMFGQPSLE